MDVQLSVCLAEKPKRLPALVQQLGVFCQNPPLCARRRLRPAELGTVVATVTAAATRKYGRQVFATATSQVRLEQPAFAKPAAVQARLCAVA